MLRVFQVGGRIWGRKVHEAKHMTRFVSLGLWVLMFVLAGSYGDGGYRQAYADSVFRVPSTRSVSAAVATTDPVARIDGLGSVAEPERPEAPAIVSRFALLQDANIAVVPSAEPLTGVGDPDGAVAAVSLPPSATSTRAYGVTLSDLEVQIRCLALNIYWEARSEPLLGKIAVAKVTLNRVKDPKFPDSICDVVRQGEESVLHQCQFSWFCDGRKDVPLNQAAWRHAKEVAYLVVLYGAPDPTRGALWYHADYADPPWTRSMTRTTQIGRHIYYIQG